MAAPAEDKELPSGDQLVTWRLIVDRPPSRRPLPEGARETAVDTLDCVAWPAGLRRSAVGWAAGDVISIEGAVRRRFWRLPAGGVSSRYEIEVVKAKRALRT